MDEFLHRQEEHEEEVQLFLIKTRHVQAEEMDEESEDDVPDENQEEIPEETKDYQIATKRSLGLEISSLAERYDSLKEAEELVHSPLSKKLPSNTHRI